MFHLDTASIVLLSFENSWARAGGLFAVVREYVRYLRERKNRDAVVISPGHKLGGDIASVEHIGMLNIPFGDRIFQVKIDAAHGDGVLWYIVTAEGFFEADGGRDHLNPYVYSSDSTRADDSRLLRDSLFFCRCVPGVLNAIQRSSNVIIHAQDWQTALATVSVGDAVALGELKDARTVLTMHNPYDQALSETTWRLLTNRPLPNDTIHTVYRRVLPLLGGCPTTVSREFARDLTNDDLQQLYFANHLQQALLECEIVGVDNGPFDRVQPAFEKGDPLPQKLERRQAMLELIQSWQTQESRVCGRLVGSNSRELTTLADSVPIFMMAGRLDPRQKGFDILASAIRRLFTEADNDARFLLTPDPGGAPAAYLDDLLRLGSEFPGRVMVCPFRATAIYRQAQAGSTFSVWPSLYEPFGGVTEFYLLGTPAVARFTGGLRQQVVDIDAGAGYSGLTYSTVRAESREEWQSVMDANSPSDRQCFPLYLDHVSKLTHALLRAIDVYANRRVTYRAMLTHLDAIISRFSWERASKEYFGIYGRTRH